MTVRVFEDASKINVTSTSRGRKDDQLPAFFRFAMTMFIKRHAKRILFHLIRRRNASGGASPPNPATAPKSNDCACEDIQSRKSTTRFADGCAAQLARPKRNREQPKTITSIHVSSEWTNSWRSNP